MDSGPADSGPDLPKRGSSENCSKKIPLDVSFGVSSTGFVHAGVQYLKNELHF